MTKDGSGEIATAIGRGVGKRIDSSAKMRYAASALFYRTVNSSEGGGEKTGFS
jgi:hypothetical protein